MREDFLVSKSYCTQTDVERAMGVAAAETNVTQTMILSSIESASDEVDLLTHTRYLSIEDSGTATTGGTTTLTDSTKTSYELLTVSVINETGQVVDAGN